MVIVYCILCLGVGIMIGASVNFDNKGDKKKYD